MSEFGSGVSVGRGRGFSKTLPTNFSKPDADSTSTYTNGSVPASNFQDDDWDESGGGGGGKTNNGWDNGDSKASGGWAGGNSAKSSSGWSGGETTNTGWSGGGSSSTGWSGGGNAGKREGGGGSRACFKCNEEGHMSRDCPNPGSGGGRGGGSRACFKCNEEGHMSRDCPNAGSGGGGGSRACFKCNQEGHMSRDCPNAGSGGGGGGSRACFKCNEEGHMSRDCPNAGSGGGGGGSRACFKCNEEGHMSRDCPNAGSGGGGGGSRACFKCNEEGHMSRDCPNAGSGGGSGSKACFKCNEEGHMSRDCPNAEKRSRECRKCGEEGHMARDCPTAGGDGEKKSGCFNCGEDGHMAKECPNPPKEQDPNKPKASTYVPPTVTENEDELFENIPAGINFSKYDTIDVKVSGDNNNIQPIKSFREAGLREHLVKNIEKHKYSNPTPVQKYTIPIVASKRDLMACAQTGSGKTAAFLLPMIQTMMESSDLPNLSMQATQEPWAVIIAPTRELASQIHLEAMKFTYNSIVKPVVVYGGTSVSSQANNLSKGAHIIVGTPGRLLMFLNDGKISFSQLRYFVLDEADRLLDMGFKGDIEKMVSHPTMPVKGERQTLMFSATFSNDVQTLARDFLHDYLFLTVGIVGAANSDVKQIFFQVGQFDKRQKLMDVIQEKGMDRTLVFVETKRSTDFVATFLSQNNMPTTSIHGDREQREREEALRDFKSGRMPILMATAVAARGLDIRDVRHVINYDLPNTIDEYVHRIGRTGRVGNIGMATSFFEPGRDDALASSLLRILAGAFQEVPSWLEEAARDGGGGGGGFGKGRGGGQFGARDTRKGQSSVTSSESWNNNETSNFSSGAPVDDESWD